MIEGGLHVGKASPITAKGCCVSYDGKELEFDKYEVLIGRADSVKWVKVHGKPNNLQFRPVEGGHEAKGDPLFIGRCHHHDGVHPGKTGPKWDGVMIGYGGDEKFVKDYEVLCLC
jgi:hypothetical protein